jgi:hypothetical protein
MKPKYLKTLSLFNKSLPNFGIIQRFISILFPLKFCFVFFKKSLKKLLPKFHSRLFNLFEQILFLAIILLFLFLLSIYFSQIKFFKKHSDILSTNKTYIYDFILAPIFFEKYHCQLLHEPSESSSKIKIDYG